MASSKSSQWPAFGSHCTYWPRSLSHTGSPVACSGVGDAATVGTSAALYLVLQSGFWSFGGSGLVPVVLHVDRSAADATQALLGWSGNNPPYTIYRGSCNFVFGGFTDVTSEQLPADAFHTLDGDFIDLDDDGDLDIVLAHAFGGNFEVYANDGDGTFTDETAAFFPAGVTGTGSLRSRGWSVESDDR